MGGRGAAERTARLDLNDEDERMYPMSRGSITRCRGRTPCLLTG
jgi:hypothetical protein